MIELEIHTDASGNKMSKDFGYSAVFNYKEVEYFQSYRITQKDLRQVLEAEEDVSNPTVEVFALTEILGKFISELILISPVKIPMKLKIYSDYKGVTHWFNKDWAMNKKYIRSLIRIARNYSQKLKTIYGIEVEVLWVKGHNGDVQNERADKLAGERLDQTNIDKFFTILKEEIYANTGCSTELVTTKG